MIGPDGEIDHTQVQENDLYNYAKRIQDANNVLVQQIKEANGENHRKCCELNIIGLKSRVLTLKKQDSDFQESVIKAEGRHKQLEERIFELEYQLNTEKEKNKDLYKSQQSINIDISELKQSKFLPDDFEIIEME